MFEGKIGRMKMFDMALVKLSVAAFVLFLITVWTGAMDWVHTVHWGWFLGVSIVSAVIVHFRTRK
jgi:hypothetical protein